MEFPKSKFAFNVASTTARPPKTNEPEIHMVAAIKGKVKMNEAGSKVLGLRPADYLVFINNRDAIDALVEKAKAGDEAAIAEVEAAGGVDNLELTWAVCKGWIMKDSAGNELTTKKPLTKKEAAKLEAEGQVDENGKVIAPDMPLYKGSRLSTKMKDNKIGMILECTDSNNAPLLRDGYDDDKHVVYSISAEAMPFEFPNGDGTVAVDLHLIEYKGLEDKVERG